MDYETAKHYAASNNRDHRRQVALSGINSPEIHCFLAKDKEPTVRHALAYNVHLSPHAALILAKDKSEKVRLRLAQSLSEQMLQIEELQRESLQKVAFMAAEQLAKDHSAKVRIALSKSLVRIAKLPPELAATLAYDVERAVAEPILIYARVLDDITLGELLATRPEAWVRSAIARREDLSEPLSEQLYKMKDIAATGVLIDNETAKINTQTLEQIVEDSAHNIAYQSPLVKRPNIPDRLLMKLSEFVDVTIGFLLGQRKDCDSSTQEQLRTTLTNRQDVQSYLNDLDNEDEESTIEMVRTLDRNGNLGSMAISDAVQLNKFMFVQYALAHLSGLEPSVIRTILESRQPRNITALCWRSGVTMRCCVRIQSHLLHIPNNKVLYPKNLNQYPIPDVDMEQIIKFYD